MFLNVEDYRVRAKKNLPKFVCDFVDGGAEDESCLRRNLRDIEQIALLPSCLRDVSNIDTSIEIFGERWKLPIAVAPTGFNGLIRPEADVMLARAAARAGIAFTLSTASNVRLERVRAEAGGINWFQLYVMSDRTIAAQMIARAKRAGFSALVLTVDVPVSGHREKDTRNGFKLPFRPTLGTLLNICAHPMWLARFARTGMLAFTNLSESENAAASAQAQAALLSRAMDRSMVWDSLKWLRAQWEGPILLKGLLHPEDAKRAIAHGMDGIIVSNHGGRQLDAAPATIQSLPAVAEAVEGRIPVLVDSGFRRGSDIVKALALGARAVLIGRPVLYGRASDGEAGASAVLDILGTELVRTMTLIGAARIDDIHSGHIWRPIYPVQQGASHV